jgi:putative transposase
MGYVLILESLLMPDYHVRTMKLKLNVTSEDRNAAWKRIRQITNDGWRAANWIAAGQLLNDQLVRRIYARRKIDPTKNKEAVQRIEDEFKQFFGTKRQATTERDIKKAFPDLPPCVTNPLNQVVVQSYKKEKRDMLSGGRSLRTYKKGMPVTTTKVSIEFSANGDDKHCVTWKLVRNERIQFEIYYGKDKANNRLTIQRILEAKDDYSAPQIQLKAKIPAKKSEVFLLLPVKEPKQNLNLDPELCVGVDLGITVPAYVALSKGPGRKAIGSKDDLLRTRTQMQSRLRRLQRSVKSAQSGKGREKKLKGLKRIEEKERNFVKSYNHFVSKDVVDFAIKNRAATIKMEMLAGFGDDEKKAFVLRNWSYFELQTMIKYKAERVGIKVVKVDPYHTSQTCSSCGHYEEGQRKSQKGFVCAKCDEKINADHNAALNIARSDKIVTKKEQCEYYRQNEPSQ